MNKRRIISFLSADLLCSSLAGCGSSDTSAKPPSEVQPSPSAEAVQPPEASAVPQAKEAIAEPADFSTLQNNDRILLMGPNDHRIVSIMKFNNALAAVASHLAEGSVVSLPDVSAILTYESGEDGAFSLCGPDGYLTTNANGQALRFGEKDEYSLWKAKEDGTLINVSAKPRSESDRDLDMGLLQFFNNTFTVMELRNDVMEIAKITPYRVKDGYELPRDDGKGYRLPLFETSDIHGYIVDTSGKENAYRLADIAGWIRDTRMRFGEERKETCLLLDGGDMFHGAVVSNLMNGKPILEAFNELKYDVVNIGNHEFEWGYQTVFDDDKTLADIEGEDGSEENLIPVVFANLLQNKEKPEFVYDYILIDKIAINEAGDEIPVRIGVIGYSLDYSSSLDKTVFSDLGYEIVEDPEILVTLGKELREYGCDAVIVLTHSDGAAMAKAIPAEANIDLVLGGHVHRNDVGTSEAGIPYVTPATNAYYYVYGELVFEKEADGSAKYERTANLHSAAYNESPMAYRGDKAAGMPDENIRAIADRYLISVRELMDVVVGHIDESIPRYDCFPDSGTRSSPGGNFVCGILRTAVDADAAFISRTGLKTDFTVEPGKTRDITVNDIYTMFPYGNRLSKFRLTYEDFMKVLEYAMTGEGAKYFTFMSGPEVYFTDQTVNAIVKDGKVLYENGKWNIDDTKETITVCLFDFAAKKSAPDQGIDNPFIVWMSTDRLLDSTVIDQEGAEKALRKIAAENNGLIPADKTSYFKNLSYPE